MRLSVGDVVQGDETERGQGQPASLKGSRGIHVRRWVYTGDASVEGVEGVGARVAGFRLDAPEVTIVQPETV